jgi:energy-coupling factor transporter ATP-binding protein EcfA2
MTLIRKNDLIPERPVIIVLYGTPGTGKTSLANTSDNPLLIDTDRGFDRAASIVDTIEAGSWEDIDSQREVMKGYKTVIIDTAKSMLDDYLSLYVCDKDYKLKTNSLKRFGQMADQFKLFVNFLRSNESDIVFICHDKETQEGDIIKHNPDCTGQSKDLLIRIADQVGYLHMVGGKRTLDFQQNDTFVTKDTASLGKVVIPDVSDPDYQSLMDKIIKDVKSAIQSKSASQQEYQKACEKLHEVSDAEGANKMMDVANALPSAIQKPFKTLMIAELEKKGITFDKKSKSFVEHEESSDKSDPA